MFDLTFTAPISLFVSLAALTGVTVHDTKLDKLATSFAGIPSMMTTAESGNKGLSGDPHTHVERVSVREMNSSQPRLAPRTEHKKHMMQKNMPKGANRYDGYTLPIVSSQL
ncbi:hypothetical protein H7142_03600 [Candidatus Saccharibacteria bacterium]|nr:hypothetical protein [Candidatus Saccharibacteria bacterium]